MPVPNLPPRDAQTGRFLESTMKDTSKNLNTPARVVKSPVPVPPVAKPLVNPTAQRNAPPVPPVKSPRDAPARPSLKEQRAAATWKKAK